MTGLNMDDARLIVKGRWYVAVMEDDKIGFICNHCGDVATLDADRRLGVQAYPSDALERFRDEFVDRHSLGLCSEEDAKPDKDAYDIYSFNTIAEQIHQTAADHGFWPEEGRNFGEMMMLICTEAAEALEEHRAGRQEYWESEGGKPEGMAVEVADIIIRAMDCLHKLCADSEHKITPVDVVLRKMNYNYGREHKHGKQY